MSLWSEWSGRKSFRIALVVFHFGGIFPALNTLRNLPKRNLIYHWYDHNPGVNRSVHWRRCFAVGRDTSSGMDLIFHFVRFNERKLNLPPTLTRHKRPRFWAVRHPVVFKSNYNALSTGNTFDRQPIGWPFVQCDPLLERNVLGTILLDVIQCKKVSIYVESKQGN